jgi:hypothetical protein
MKTLRPFFCLAILILIIFSCKKTDPTEKIDNSISEETFSTSLPNIRVSDGILVFNSNEDYKKFYDLTQNWNDEKIKMWEDQIGFRSLKTNLYLINTQLNAITDELEFYNAIKQNSKYIEIVNRFGDQYVMPKISCPNYQQLINKDGLLIINQSVYKVIEDFIIISNIGNIELLRNIEANEINDLPKDQYFVYNYKNPNKLKILTSDFAALNYDPSGCTGDRRVEVTMGAETWYEQINWVTYYRTSVYVKICGFKKNFLCMWLSYNTSISWANVSFAFSQQGHYISDTWSDVTSDGDVSELRRSWVYIDWGTSNPTAAPDFSQMHVDATTRGMDGLWVTIDH